MSRFNGLREDFRNGTIIAAIAACLLLVALALHPSTERFDNNAFREVIDAQRPVVAKHRSPLIHVQEPANAAAVPVLCHHFFRENTSPFGLVKILGALFLNLPLIDNMDVWNQTAASFEKQMAYLSEQGYVTVGLDDLVAWRFGLKTLPAKSVVITFDDGDRSVLDVAYPVLRRHGFKATLFVVTSQVGQEWDGIDGMTWEELRLLQQSGVFTIESHTSKLHYKVKTSQGRLPVFLAMSKGLYDPPGAEPWEQIVLRDLAESRRVVATHLGYEPHHLAWPYGSADSALDSLATVAGFHTVSTLEDGMNERVGDDSYRGDNTDSGHRVEYWPPAIPALDARLAAASPADSADRRFAIGILSSSLPGHPAARIPWEGFEIRRYTITARTSMRGLDDMLSPTAPPHARFCFNILQRSSKVIYC
jgi:peptidoglycan/xylan/chitin deacetylase (PgdA/CDA1 family)